MRGSGWNECEKSVPLFLQQSGMQRRVSEGGTRVADEWCPCVCVSVRPSRRQFSFTALAPLPHYTALPPLPHYTALPPLPHYTALPPLPHYIALPPLPHYNVSARPLPKFICQNIDISNAKFHRARTFGRINYSRKHLTHSKFSKHGNFTKFKPSETSHVHLVSILRIPVFDRMQKNQFFHSSPLNFCHHVCSLLGIHYLLRAHFSHRSRAHCWFHHRKKSHSIFRTRSCFIFLFLSRLNLFWVFGK